MRKGFRFHSAPWLLGAAMLLVLAAACGETIVKEVPVEKIVTQDVIKEVVVEVEKVVEVTKEVVKEVRVEVPVEVIKEVLVIKEVPKTIVEERVVVKEVEKIVIATAVPVGQRQFMLSTLSANPKYGGTLRIANHGPPAHFDLFQSGTIANIGAQAPMYDLLIRWDPRIGEKTVIPDLAHRWEISSDALTYTFFLREGVKFHDGTDFTAEDIKTTWDRIVFPPTGVPSARQATFSTVSAINVVDPYTIEFKMSEPRPSAYMLGSFASGWNIATSKKTLEENDFNLRKVPDYPGTGPFKHVSRAPERWIMEKNPDYWNPNTPYVDGLEVFYIKAYTPEMAGAYLGNLVDWASFLDATTFRQLEKTAGMGTLRYQGTGSNVNVFNTTVKPFDDARVRRAFYLITDHWAMSPIVDDIRVGSLGQWYHPASPYALSDSELEQKLPYKRDKTDAIAEAKRLMADAGLADGFSFEYLIRESPIYPRWGQAIQAALKEHLNVEATLRIHESSVFLDDIANGDFAFSTGSGLGGTPVTSDPAAYLRATFGKCGDVICSSNFSRWDNAEANDLITKFERELDSVKRAEIAAQLAELLDREVPSFLVQWVYNLFAWYDYVKGMPTAPTGGGYDLYRLDQLWLDK